MLYVYVCYRRAFIPMPSEESPSSKLGGQPTVMLKNPICRLHLQQKTQKKNNTRKLLHLVSSVMAKQSPRPLPLRSATKSHLCPSKTLEVLNLILKFCLGSKKMYIIARFASVFKCFFFSFKPQHTELLPDLGPAISSTRYGQLHLWAPTQAVAKFHLLVKLRGSPI